MKLITYTILDIDNETLSESIKKDEDRIRYKLFKEMQRLKYKRHKLKQKISDIEEILNFSDNKE